MANCDDSMAVVHGPRLSPKRVEHVQAIGDLIYRVVKDWHARYLTDEGKERGRFVICAGLVVLEYARTGFPLADATYISGKGELRTSGRFVQRILERFGVTKLFASAGGRTSRGTLPAAIDLANRINALEQISSLDPNARSEVMVPSMVFLADRARALLSEARLVTTVRASDASNTMVATILATAKDRRGYRMMIRFLARSSFEMVVGSVSVYNPGLPSAATDDEFSLLIGDSCVAIDDTASPRRVADLDMRYWDGFRIHYLVPESELDVARRLIENGASTTTIFLQSIETTIGYQIEEMAGFEHDRIPDVVRDLIDRFNRSVSLDDQTRPLQLEVHVEPAERHLREPFA